MVGLKRRLVDAEARQREIANLDPLTGIANRRAFDSALRRELAARLDSQNGRRRSDDEPFALLVFDLDDFKSINDDYGHPVGDAVLRQTAERARDVLRSTDLLARIGGDEFAVIAPGSHGEGAARMGEAIARRDRRARAGLDAPRLPAPRSASPSSPATASRSRRCCAAPTSGCCG